MRNYLHGIRTVTHVGPLPQRHGSARISGRGDSLQIWKVAANMLHKQSRKTTMDGLPAWFLAWVYICSS
jgi:hypothetical protein